MNWTEEQLQEIESKWHDAVTLRLVAWLRAELFRLWRAEVVSGFTAAKEPYMTRDGTGKLDQSLAAKDYFLALEALEAARAANQPTESLQRKEQEAWAEVKRLMPDAYCQ